MINREHLDAFLDAMHGRDPMIRKPDPVHKLPERIEVAIGDLLDPVAVEEAMKGVDKLFLLNAVTADEITQALITFGPPGSWNSNL
jgi:hypothetical protein